jgi:hypothetical protein
VLRGAIAVLLGPDAAIGRCSLDRAKLKPGRKLTAYYSVQVLRSDRLDRRPVEVVWNGAGDDAAGETEAETEAGMEEEARVAGIATPFRRLRGAVPDLHMRLRVAPLDINYPQLVRLCRPDYVREMLATVHAWPGAPELAAPEYRVTPLRYRPRQRHVLRYEPLTQSPAGPVFAKLYRNGAAERALRVATTVADLVTVRDTAATAVRPLPGWSRDDVVLYPRVAGAPLSQRLWDGGPGPSRHLAGAGALLRALQQDPGDLVVDLDRRDLRAEVASVARAAEHLGPLLPATAARVDELLHRAGELGAAIPSSPPCFAHGDYKADHVWIARDRLTLLDFDTCGVAEPALDVGKFLADLTWWYATTRRPGLADAQQQFLAGYGASSLDQLARARLYEAVVLTKLTIRRLRRFESDWAARTQELVEHATRLLDAVAAGETAGQIRRSSGSAAR